MTALRMSTDWRRRAQRGIQCGNATDPGEIGGAWGEFSFLCEGQGALECVRPESWAQALESVAVSEVSG
uniref:Uncharacterized protein n=1 Tax=Hucho hucho TaxID=62062 RepID=A0A4W5MSI6_9TELE